jgi:hypothetical protein
VGSRTRPSSVDPAGRRGLRAADAGWARPKGPTQHGPDDPLRLAVDLAVRGRAEIGRRSGSRSAPAERRDRRSPPAAVIPPVRMPRPRTRRRALLRKAVEGSLPPFGDISIWAADPTSSTATATTSHPAPRSPQPSRRRPHGGRPGVSIPAARCRDGSDAPVARLAPHEVERIAPRQPPLPARARHRATLDRARPGPCAISASLPAWRSTGSTRRASPATRPATGDTDRLEGPSAAGRAEGAARRMRRRRRPPCLLAMV